MNTENDTKNRATMNRKPVITAKATTIINLESGFASKLLCDGPTFTMGSACVFSCAFCYVPDIMRRNPHKLVTELPHSEIVVRRADPIKLMRSQLTFKNGKPKFDDPADKRVIYSSPLVDVAGNMELVRETIGACKTILGLTHWHIRLLSKSNLLPYIAHELREHRERLIFGVSTGTLNDEVAGAYEQGAPKVSKRLSSLRLLQDEGFRTFGMLCPSLPMENADAYADFANEAARAIRANRCEHVWAEPLNARGDAMEKTIRALRAAGFNSAAAQLAKVSESRDEWELYARHTFEAHATVYRSSPGKLRFLQYVRKDTAPYWAARVEQGAVLL